MKQPISGKKLLVRYFCIMLIVTLLCLLICGQYAIYTARTELEYCNRAALELFYDGLNRTMDDLQNFNEDIYANDLNFNALSSDSSTISTEQRILYQFNLRRLMQTSISDITGLFIFNAEDDFSYYCFGNAFLGGTFSKIHIQTMQEVKDYWLDQNESNMLVWIPLRLQDRTIMMNATCKRGLYICAMVDIQAYSDTYTAFDNSNHIEYVLYNNNTFLSNLDYVEVAGLKLEDINENQEEPSLINWGQHIIESRFNSSTGIGLCGIISMDGLWGNLQIFVIMLAVALVIVCLLFYFMYSMLQRMLIYPMNQITAASKQIAEGSQAEEHGKEYIRELEDIRRALSKLVEQKVSLERDNIAQAYQKEHALLQYYQLQTRSHFILNCLKSIYNLSAKGELEKTQQIISLFSNHIRYVFHDSLSLVTLRAELDEVNDYFRIIQLERSDAILLNQSVDPELMNFKIPPLIIQIFLENFNKFNAPTNKILRFSIRIDKVEMDGTDYVRLRLTDNGVGYSEEALQNFQRPETKFEQYHVGIQNLCRRMDLLYKDKYQIAFFNNPSGGANSVIYLPVETE